MTRLHRILQREIAMDVRYPNGQQVTLPPYLYREHHDPDAWRRHHRRRENRLLVLGAALLTAFGLLLYAAVAKAEMLKEIRIGVPLQIHQPLMACDTVDQAREVVEAAALDIEEAERVFQGYAKQDNQYGEPTCGLIPARAILVFKGPEFVGDYQGKPVTVSYALRLHPETRRPITANSGAPPILAAILPGVTLVGKYDSSA